MNNKLFKKIGSILLTLLIAVTVFSLFPTVTKAETTNVTWSNGSLDNTLTKINEADKASIGKTTGKWYWEITIKDTWVESAVAIGITGETGTLPSSSWDRIAAYGFTPELFVKTKNTSDRIQRTNYGSKFGNKDVIGVALDLDNDKITWYKNGVSQGLSIAKPSDLAGLQVFPLIINGTTSEKTLTANFGASDFKYPIPEGFLPYQDSGTSTTPDPSTKPDPSTTPDPSTKPDPSDTDGASQPTGDRAILTVTMDNGFDKEFDLSKKELNAFIAWYDAKDAGRGASFFAIDKHNNNKGPFSNRKDYVIFNKILTFEVSEYSTK
ncbi:SPRY domain-containing protein [Paenibacillus polymyxa]|uniref:SPRY domain-containing protein n=1 Tax=Paenibacillus polymyxa TaxID=1406 RepID=UPI00041E578E|nr:SPRY domain-containing protein [Paenibacillus polymyxa]